MQIIAYISDTVDKAEAGSAALAVSDEFLEDVR